MEPEDPTDSRPRATQSGPVTTPEQREHLWNHLPDVHKKIEGGARWVLVKREEPERVWVGLKELTMGEYCYLRSFAWTAEFMKKRETKKRIELEKQKRQR